MGKLENVSVEELHDALDRVEGKKPTQRLMLAILYKQGPSVPMIADWFSMRAETIYEWFTAMENEPLLDAVHDGSRPGRPSKLSGDEREEFEAVLRDSPDKIGLAGDVWTPALAQKYVREEFDVDYTLRHVRRLMHEAGVSW